MTVDESASENERFKQIVSELVAAARNRAGNAEALSARLQQLGISSERGARYSVSAVSNWVQGRTMPPADVFLAVASIGQQSIDEALGQRGDETTAELQATVARLQAEMMNLYSRLGVPYEPGGSGEPASDLTGTDG